MENQYQQVRKVTNDCLDNLDKQIKDLQERKKAVIAGIIKDYAILKIGERIRIQWPNPVIPKELLEITGITFERHFMDEDPKSGSDIVYHYKSYRIGAKEKVIYTKRTGKMNQAMLQVCEWEYKLSIPPKPAWLEAMGESVKESK